MSSRNPHVLKPGFVWLFSALQNSNTKRLLVITPLILISVLLWMRYRVEIVPSQLTVVASPFPPPLNSYRHFEYLSELRQQAAAMAATNRGVFGCENGKLPASSPLRPLLGIPAKEPAKVTCVDSLDGRHSIRVYSPRTRQRFGVINLDRRTGVVQSVYDLRALYLLSELERRAREALPTRRDAVKLCSDESYGPKGTGMGLAEAILVKPESNLSTQMTMPHGTSLILSTIWSNSAVTIAEVTYSGDTSFLGVLLGLEPPSGSFGILRLLPAWTNFNTQGFLLDAEGFPYPR